VLVSRLPEEIYTRFCVYLLCVYMVPHTS
jgi:hypothetical protein